MNTVTPSSSRMSQRRRALLTIGFAVIHFFGFLTSTFTVSNSFWPTILIPVGAGIYLFSLRCPNCGAPIYKRRAKLLGVDLTYWGGLFLPTKCSQCAKELGSS